MKRRTYRGPSVAVVLLATLFLFGKAALADEEDYRQRTGRAILSGRTRSPRATGMGGSYAAHENGAHATYTNPAMLGAVQRPRLSNQLGVGQIREDGRSTTLRSVTVAGAWALRGGRGGDKPQHGMGVRYTHLAGGAGGQNGADFSTQLFSLGYGRPFNYGRVLAGASLTWQGTHVGDSEWADMELTRCTFRAGVLLRMTSLWSVGGVLSLGSGTSTADTGIEEEEGLVTSRGVRLGSSVELREGWLLTSDLAYEKLKLNQANRTAAPSEVHHIVRFSVGSEWANAPEGWRVRSGVFLDSDEWEMSRLSETEDRTSLCAGITAGSEWRRDRWSVEYNAEVTTLGDHSHQCAFELEF